MAVCAKRQIEISSLAGGGTGKGGSLPVAGRLLGVSSQALAWGLSGTGVAANFWAVSAIPSDETLACSQDSYVGSFAGLPQLRPPPASYGGASGFLKSNRQKVQIMTKGLDAMVSASANILENSLDSLLNLVENCASGNCQPWKSVKVKMSDLRPIVDRYSPPARRTQSGEDFDFEFIALGPVDRSQSKGAQAYLIRPVLSETPRGQDPMKPVLQRWATLNRHIEALMAAASREKLKVELYPGLPVPDGVNCQWLVKNIINRLVEFAKLAFPSKENVLRACYTVLTEAGLFQERVNERSDDTRRILMEVSGIAAVYLEDLRLAETQPEFSEDTWLKGSDPDAADAPNGSYESDYYSDASSDDSAPGFYSEDDDDEYSD